MVVVRTVEGIDICLTEETRDEMTWAFLWVPVLAALITAVIMSQMLIKDDVLNSILSYLLFATMVVSIFVTIYTIFWCVTMFVGFGYKSIPILKLKADNIEIIYDKVENESVNAAIICHAVNDIEKQIRARDHDCREIARRCK